MYITKTASTTPFLKYALIFAFINTNDPSESCLDMQLMILVPDYPTLIKDSSVTFNALSLG